ncbi:hypothetical protein F5887DRAFT_1074462 [Amanita rubescens]|nr:hypothetical protein F5887DRAFT_1074462 [Amanita rubescens]
MLKSKQPSPRELYNQRKLKEERERTAFLPPGLLNHGNTCFMNSVLQGIIATRLLHDLATFAPISTELKTYPLLDPARSPQLTNGHGVAGPHEQTYIDCMPIGDRLLSVMYRAWDAQSERRRESISPKPLLNALGRKYQQYLDFAQQDAHEFMRILFDAVRMEEIDVIKKRQPQLENKKSRKKKHVYSAKRRRSSTAASLSDTPSGTLLPFTDMIFGGQLTSILVCQNCKRISQTYEDFYDISLSIKPEDYASSSTSPPPSASSTVLFSLGRSLSGVKEKGKGETKEKGKVKEAENEEHGRERRRDRFKKFAKRITTFNDAAFSNQANHVEPEMPRSSSVPPADSAETKLDDAKSRRDSLRKRRSRSLGHLNKATTLETVRDGSEEREGLDDEQGSGDGSTGRDDANTTAPSTHETVESDWSIVKEEAEPCEETSLQGDEKKKKKKDKEEDGWVKFGKRLNILAWQAKDKESGVVDEVRAKKKSRESSPDPSGRSTPRRDHANTPPPLPTKTQPTISSPSLSPPAIHHHPSSLPVPKSSPLSQPPYQSPLLKVVPSILKPTTTPSGCPSISHALLHLNEKPSGTPKVSLKHKHKLHIHSPTSAEAEYLRRILADIDVSGSGSSPTTSGGWPPAASAPSHHALVNPFALLMKSSGTKKGSEGSEIGSKVDATAAGAAGTGTGETRPSHKWSSWLGMNRLSGVEECLRLFTSVEVLDNENVVGCRRCWKMAYQERERGDSQEEGDEHEDGMDDEESSSEEEDETSFQRSPTSLLTSTQTLTTRPEEYERLSMTPNTPGGMPIPIIATTGPESPLEPPSRPRIPHPLRSNSADFVSLSALSSRENTPILDASTLHRNASSPSIPSTVVSPHSTPHPRSSYPPYPLSQLYSRPVSQVGERESLVIPRAPITRRGTAGVDSTDNESDESISAMDSRSGGEDADDRLSLGSSSSLSPPRSGESSKPRSLSDSGCEKAEEPPGLDIVVTGAQPETNGEAGET